MALLLMLSANSKAEIVTICSFSGVVTSPSIEFKSDLKSSDRISFYYSVSSTEFLEGSDKLDEGCKRYVGDEIQVVSVDGDFCKGSLTIDRKLKLYGFFGSTGLNLVFPLVNCLE